MAGLVALGAGGTLERVVGVVGTSTDEAAYFAVAVRAAVAIGAGWEWVVSAAEREGDMPRSLSASVS